MTKFMSRGRMVMMWRARNRTGRCYRRTGSLLRERRDRERPPRRARPRVPWVREFRLSCLRCQWFEIAQISFDEFVCMKIYLLSKHKRLSSLRSHHLVPQLTPSRVARVYNARVLSWCSPTGYQPATPKVSPWFAKLIQLSKDPVGPDPKLVIRQHRKSTWAKLPESRARWNHAQFANCPCNCPWPCDVWTAMDRVRAAGSVYVEQFVELWAPWW